MSTSFFGHFDEKKNKNKTKKQYKKQNKTGVPRVGVLNCQRWCVWGPGKIKSRHFEYFEKYIDSIVRSSNLTMYIRYVIFFSNKPKT